MAGFLIGNGFFTPHTFRGRASLQAGNPLGSQAEPLGDNMFAELSCPIISITWNQVENQRDTAKFHVRPPPARGVRDRLWQNPEVTRVWGPSAHT